MNNLSSIKIISLKEIETENYIESLLNLSLSYKIITKEEYRLIISNLTSLLKEELINYSQGLISSLSHDTIMSIKNNILFILGFYLKNQNSNEGINSLKNINCIKLYSKSLIFIDSEFKSLRLFYQTVFYKSLIKTENYYYNATLKMGLTAFFQNYNFKTNALDIIITADYLPYLKIEKKKGLLFMKEYLNYLYYENLFLNKFSEQKIHLLLKHLYVNYKNLPVNIFKEVVINAIILEYLNIDMFTLNFKKINFYNLKEDYLKDAALFKSKLHKAFTNVLTKIKVSGNSQTYLIKCSKPLIDNIIFTMKYNIHLTNK